MTGLVKSPDFQEQTLRIRPTPDIGECLLFGAAARKLEESQQRTVLGRNPMYPFHKLIASPPHVLILVSLQKGIVVW